MCDFCGNSIHEIETTITDAEGSKVYCPNDLIMQCCSGEMILVPDDTLFDEVFHKPGAVKIEDGDTTYILSPQSARRLINHSLAPFELTQIMRNRGLDEVPPGDKFYQIHDDFYNHGGIPIQPCISNQDLTEMYEDKER